MKKNRNKLLLVIIFLFISIGFAYLSTNLSINGIALIKKSVWDVHFENIVDDNEGAELNVPAVITNDKHTVNFEVTLDSPGDEYYFYVDVVNRGTMDVMLWEWNIDGISKVSDYIEVNLTYSDGTELSQYDLLEEGSSDTLKVVVKYKDIDDASMLPQSDSDFTLKLETTYNQADNNAKAREYAKEKVKPIIKFIRNDNFEKLGDWYNKGLEYTVKVIDDSSIASVKYCVTSEEECVPNIDATLTNNAFIYEFEDGNKKICVEAVDRDSNKTTTCSKTNKVDKTAPIINNFVVTQEENFIVVSLDSSDDTSGIDSYYFSKDNGKNYIRTEDNNYTFTNLDEGSYDIVAYSMDRAGNKSILSNKTINLEIYRITYDYNTEFEFEEGSISDTGFTLNWDRNFEIEESVSIPDISASRYLMIGGWNDDHTKQLNVELYNNLHRVFIGGVPKQLDYKLPFTYGNDIEFKASWSSNLDHFTSTLTSLGNQSTYSGDYTISGRPDRTLKIGTNDNREIGVFQPLKVNSLKIIQNYYYDDVIELPQPTKEYYTFEGWYSDVSLTKKVSSTKDIKEDTVLYAKWRKNKAYIRFKISDGELESNDKSLSVKNGFITKNGKEDFYSLDFDQSLNTEGLPDCNNSSYINIIRVGYEVVNGKEWKNDNGTLFNQSQVYSSLDFCNSKNKDCYADLSVNWKSMDDLTINYVNSKDQKFDSVNIKYNSLLPLPSVNSVDGWTTDGWYDTNKFVNRHYNTERVKEDLTLYLKWVEGVRIDVNLNLDGVWYSSLSLNGNIVGTFDVYLNDIKVIEDKYDYYVIEPVGTKYLINDIKANPGYRYIGASSYEGVMELKSKSIVLFFETIK